MKKPEIITIGILLFLVAYLCTGIFLLSLSLDEPTISSARSQEIDAMIQNTGLSIAMMIGVVLTYISAPFLFILGKLADFIGINPYNAVFPNSYPLVTSLVTIGVYALILYWIQRRKTA